MLKRIMAVVSGIAIAAASPAATPKPRATTPPKRATVAPAAPSVRPVAAVLPPFRLSPGEYFPVKNLRPGMTGYGLTVFKGVKIEKFAVKVIGVMPQGDLGRPLVLVMLKGGPITERQANLIQGMSGSPIYIDGKILGAFALGESTGREPIGMVRPIEDMVDAFDPRLPSRPLFASAPSDGTEPAPALTLPAAETVASPAGFGESLFRPLPVPLFAAGASPRTVKFLNEKLSPLGLQVMAGPGGGGDGDVPAYFPKNVRLEPGSSIAVSLMQGDVDLTAIGTVTYRRGNRILAFGHPFLQLGPAEYPASTAYIHDVFSSIVVSHKYGSPIRTVGTIIQDGPFSVGGLLHRMPNMVPMKVHVTDQTTGRRKDFNIRMVNHPLLLPNLILSGAQEVVGRVRAFPGESMAKVSFTIVPEGYAPIQRTNRFFDASNIATAALQDVSDSLFILSRNPFEPVKIKSVDINVDLMSGHNTAVVQRAWVEKDKVEPGDTVTVQTVIKPYKKPVETRSVSVKIPENAATGSAQIVVYGGQTGFGTITASVAPPSGTSVSTSAMTVNVKQLLTKYQERAKNDELGVNILLPGSAVSVNGERFSGLPDPLAAVMKSTKASNTRLERDEVMTREKVPYVLAGAQVLALTIEKKNAIERSGAPTTTTSTATATVSSDSSDEPDATSVDSSADSGDDGEAGTLLSHLSRGIASVRPFVTIPVSRLLKLDDAPGDAPKKDDSKGKDEAKAATKADAKADTKTDAKTETTETAASETKPADAAKDGTGPGRVAKAWKQLGKAAFEAGKLSGTTATSTGDLRLTAKLGRVTETTQPYVWSLLPLGDGTVLAGTGNAGDVLRVTPDGKTSVFARTDDLQVHALAADGHGNVFIGTSPKGRILKVDASGASRPFFDTGERYVFALVSDDSGNLYAGTGPDGKLFAISPDGKGRELLRLPEAHVMSLALEKDGNILAGTAPDGLLYRITPDGQAKVIFDAAESTVTSVAVSGTGDLLVSTAPSGKVYKVFPDGRGEVLLEKAEDSILSLVAREDGTVYAAGGKKVYAIAPDKTVATLDNDDQNQIVSLASAPDGSLWAGSANTGVIYRSVPEPAGTLLSSVHDAGLRARWGRMESLADVPEGARLEIQTRSGNVAQPDTTWSDWSAPTLNGAAAAVSSPAARFIQYRATLNAGPDGKSPVLHWVSIRYLTDNRPPTVKFSDPKDGDRWSGKKTVKWTGSDPDSDVVTYTLYASPDNGVTWNTLNTQTVKSDKPAASNGAKTDKPAAGDAAKTDAAKADAAKAILDEKARQEAKNNETAKKVEAELGTYSELSPEMRTAILQTATTALKGKSEEKTDSSESLSKTTFSWDTADQKDGVYRLKVVASDKTSNPIDALTDEAVSGPVILSNAKPTISADKATLKVASDRTVTLQGKAGSPSVAVLKVSYRIDGGDWKAAVPADGIFDSPDEGWTLATDALDSSEHAIDVKATDEVDNTATTTVKVTVP